MTKEELELELGRAYRAIIGFNFARKDGKLLDDTAYAYHALTIAAAKRFVFEGKLDGSNYFVGKSVDILQKYFKDEQR